MNDLRVSRYLNQVEIGDGTSLLFNGMSLCIDLVPTDYARLLLQDGRPDLSFLSAEEQEHLLNRGHLTRLTASREVAEFRKLVEVILEKRLALDAKRTAANLCFILTYDCNLACGYCYQHSLASRHQVPPMSGEFVDTFFSQYFSQLFPKRPKKLLITLFGGEPLLPGNRQAITRILAWAKRRNSVRVSVSTNATTVHAMADLIGPERGKIADVQVTLDGDRLLHDANRVTVSGQPTFDTVIAAIRRLAESQARVSLRIHVHPGKLDATDALLRFLEEEKILGHPQVSVYFSPISSFTGDGDSLEESALFSRIFQEVAAKTGRLPSNLEFMGKFLDMQGEKVLPKVKFCGIGREDFRIIDGRGDIYGCYEEAGHRTRRLGTLARGEIRFRSLQQTYAKRHLLNLPECLKCSAALFCGGGCPSEARVQKGSIFKSFCHQNKAFIAQSLKAFYLKRR